MKDGFLKVGVASVDVEVANPIHNKEKIMEVMKKSDPGDIPGWHRVYLSGYGCW